MLNIRVGCLGLSPLIMNRAGPERLQRWVVSPGDQTPLADQAADFESRIYRSPDGQVALSRDMLLTALTFAGRKIKLGRSFITSGASTLLGSVLRIDQEWLPLHGVSPGTDPVFVRDVRQGIQRVGRQRTKVRLVRPKLMTWGFTVDLATDGATQASLARRLFELAGTDAGLGDFRPSLPNGSGWPSPFGRFQVSSWEVDEEVDSPPVRPAVYETVASSS